MHYSNMLGLVIACLGHAELLVFLYFCIFSPLDDKLLYNRLICLALENGCSWLSTFRIFGVVKLKKPTKNKVLFVLRKLIFPEPSWSKKSSYPSHFVFSENNLWIFLVLQ